MKQYLKRFQIFFHILCQASAASLIIYWIYRYGLNNDLCTIEYKTFLNDKGDVYPVLSLCIKNPISDKILLLQNPRVNQSVYIDFLKGEYFDPSFVNIDYKNVTMDMSDYLISDFKKYANGSKSYTNLNPHDKKERISKNTAWILYDDLYNCYSLNVPQNKQMERYGVVLKASIFPNNTRPSNSGFISLIHYPDQLMTSGGTIKYSWPELDRHDKVIMRFKINGVEVLKRRTNGKQLCNPNWEKYDDTVLVKHLSQVGCRAPYQFPSKHFPVCHSQEEMAKAKMDFLSNTFEVNPPCKTIEKLYYTFEESSSPHLDDGQFEVAIYFFDQQFKEILRSRYNFQFFIKPDHFPLNLVTSYLMLIISIYFSYLGQ